MYREICEDLLYVQLNLILAVNILSYLNVHIDNANLNRTIFITDINNILTSHINKYSLGYSCLQELREYSINKFTVKQLKLIYAKYFKEEIDEKTSFISYISKFKL